MAHGQGHEAFVITKNGLEPTLLRLQMDDATAQELYARSVNWLEMNKEPFKISVDVTTANELIQFSAVQWNATNLDERYFIARYHIRLSFEEDGYQFEPTAIQLKLNSKYDMGWEELDLTDGATYFKNDKLIRKYKSYVSDLMAPLNELQQQLLTYLKGD